MFKLHYTRKALKNLSKIDQAQQRFMLSWLEKNLESCEDPRKYGKALKGNMKSYWRYRLGDYRIIAEIQDEKIMIVVVNSAHRKDIYKRSLISCKVKNPQKFVDFLCFKDKD